MILFLGPGPDGLHLMAEGLARAHADASVDVVSAALHDLPPPPVAVEVMNDAGIDITRLSAQSLVDVEVFSFDMVVTLEDFDASCRPNLPGMPPHYHWDVGLPPLQSSWSELRRGYDEAARVLRERLQHVFASDMLSGLWVVRTNLELVLDNLAHAVMAHTVNRRIFYFNEAAERITGCSRGEVIGKDCHEVFPVRRFCGGDCLFCEARPDATRAGSRTTQVTHTRKDGTDRVLEMTVAPLSDATGAAVGALVSFRDDTELHVLKRRAARREDLCGIIGHDPKMLALFDQIREVAAVNVPVLIQGESGTGKELIARAIHDLSPRSDRAFVPVNCGALPEGILESELFGHVRGAFTGAVMDKRGRFEMANGGTLFLDEIAELSPPMQVKLLRVLQEHRLERVGSEKSIPIDVRILCATHQNLRALLDKGRFRGDLYYRLCVVPIHAPPLRERRSDIPLLVERFLEQIARDNRRPLLTPTPEAMGCMLQYPWPGNVRELRNALEYVQVKCRAGSFGPQHLPSDIPREPDAAPRRSRRRGPLPKLDRARVEQALARAKGNRAQAARILGVGRTTLYRCLTLWGISSD